MRAATRMCAAAIVVAVASLLATGRPPVLSAQTAPSPAGAWESERGRVTLVEQGGMFTGSWEGPASRRGEVTGGQLRGLTLTLEYVTAPDGARGTAVFTWNARSQAWEGNWRHRDGRLGGWNLRRRGSGSAVAGPVRIVEVRVEPTTVRAGSAVELVVRYEITGGQIAVTEVRRIVGPDGNQKGLWRDGKTLGAGTHASSRRVNISPSARPGAYQFRAEIQVGSRQAVRPATFTIVGGTP